MRLSLVPDVPWNWLPNKSHLQETAMDARMKMETTAKIPAEINTKLRALSHDLANSIETIMQASYLLAQASLDDTSKKWLELIDGATRDAARINRETRDILRAQSNTGQP